MSPDELAATPLPDDLMERDNIEGFGLSPQQRLSWRLRQEGAPAGFVSCLVAVEGLSDPSRLEAHLNRIAERHEILRTRFEVLPPAGVT